MQVKEECKAFCSFLKGGIKALARAGCKLAFWLRSVATDASEAPFFSKLYKRFYCCKLLLVVRLADCVTFAQKSSRRVTTRSVSAHVDEADAEKCAGTFGMCLTAGSRSNSTVYPRRQPRRRTVASGLSRPVPLRRRVQLAPPADFRGKLTDVGRVALGAKAHGESCAWRARLISSR